MKTNISGQLYKKYRYLVLNTKLKNLQTNKIFEFMRVISLQKCMKTKVIFSSANETQLCENFPLNNYTSYKSFVRSCKWRIAFVIWLNILEKKKNKKNATVVQNVVKVYKKNKVGELAVRPTGINRLW